MNKSPRPGRLAALLAVGLGAALLTGAALGEAEAPAAAELAAEELAGQEASEAETYLPPAALSTNFGDQFVTSAEFRDAAGNPSDTFGIYDAITIHFTYAVPDNLPIAAGDTMTVQIPPELALPGHLTFNLYDNSGAVAGRATVDALTNVITITFSDLFENLPLGRSGHFRITTSWNRELVSVGDVIDLRIPASGSPAGGNLTVGEGVSIPEDEVLTKWGWVNPDPELPIIHWVARVNVAGDDIHNAWFRDNLGPGQELILDHPEFPQFNPWIFVGTMENQLFWERSGYYPNHYGRLNVVPDRTSFEIDLGDLVVGSSTALPFSEPGSEDWVTLVIHYTTLITDNRALIEEGYTNDAALYGNEIQIAYVYARTPVVDGDGTGQGHATPTPDPTPDPTREPEGDRQTDGPTLDPDPSATPSPSGPAHDSSTPSLPVTGATIGAWIALAAAMALTGVALLIRRRLAETR
ncbi:MAG: Ig-like domain-containing protein [Promicromonosporaceae bacterium]|nr:Ig-like domain-containing protein [Promicromonosporaceae bacterium]